MKKRPVDKTKKSNIKCEHCKFYNHEIWCCQRIKNVNLSIQYWRKCENFEWEEMLNIMGVNHE